HDLALAENGGSHHNLRTALPMIALAQRAPHVPNGHGLAQGRRDDDPPSMFIARVRVVAARQIAASESGGLFEVANAKPVLPKGEGWLYEVKFDGYRMQVHKADERVIFYTRNGADWTDRFPRLSDDLASLPCTSAIIDAELVHADSFEALHRAAHKRA